MKKPNILLLTIDTLRADRLGCYGHDRSLTPNIDRLAASSIRFSQAITGGSWTQAAFPTIITSTGASMYGGCLGRLASERPSPVAALADNGYRTAAFSTNPHLSTATGYNRGFQHFEDLIPNERKPFLQQIKGGQRLLRQPLTHKVSKNFGQHWRPVKVYSSAIELTTSFESWLQNVTGPYFAWLHYMDVHWPYHIEDELINPDDIAQAWRDLAIMHERASFKRERDITPAQRDHFQCLYEKALQYLDVQIGRLLDLLNQYGMAENTIIILVSDHGEEFLDHGRWGHWESNLFDEIVRVPLLIRLPGQKSGKVVRRLVRTLDLMPTILDLCGCSLSSGVQGQSLAPLWQENGETYNVNQVITEMHRPPWHRVAIRTEAYKYIWDNKKPNKPDLYDLRDDPGETRNVGDQYPQVVQAFQVQVDTYLQLVRHSEPEEAAPQLELDDATVARLRALGYVD